MSVKVYEVGRSQLIDLVDSDISQECGDWVVVSMCSTFGEPLRCLTLIERYNSEYWACHSAQNMENISLYGLMHGRSHFARRYEVWHVVDDGDLWDEWEQDVEVSRRENEMREIYREAAELEQGSEPRYVVRFEDDYGTMNEVVFKTFNRAELFCDALESEEFPTFTISISWKVCGRFCYDFLTVVHHVDCSADYYDDIPL